MMNIHVIISLIAMLLAWNCVLGQPTIYNYFELNNCADTLETDFGGVIVMKFPENEKMRFGHFMVYDMYCAGYLVMTTGGGGMSSKVNMDWDFINEYSDTMTISFGLGLGSFHFYDIPKFQKGKFKETSTCFGRMVKLDSIIPPNSRLRQMVMKRMVWNPELTGAVRHESKHMMLVDRLFYTHRWSECLTKISD